MREEAGKLAEKAPKAPYNRVAINGASEPLTKAAREGRKPAPKYGACDGTTTVLANGSTPAATNQAPGGADGAQNSPRPPDWLELAAGRVPCLGILLSLCASFFLGSAGMLVKMTSSVHGIQVAVLRAFIQLFVYLAIIMMRRLPLVPKRREELLPVMGRASLGAASITCSYYALKLIPLGDATVIRFSLPIWTLIVAYLLLDETCNLIKLVAVVVSMSGVILIAKPEACIYLGHLMLNQLGFESDAAMEAHLADYNNEPAPPLPLDEEYAAAASLASPLPAGSHFKGCLLALASSVCLAMSLIALRLCKRTPAEITILWLSIYSILLGSATLLAMGEWRLPDSLKDWLYVLLNGFCGAAGQWFITSALKVEQSGVISLARTADIQVAFLYSALLLHEHITATSIVGSLLVSSGVLAVVVPQWLKARRAANRPSRSPADAEAAPPSHQLPPLASMATNGQVKRHPLEPAAEK